MEHVEVADEPRHIEQLRNEHVRVYLATIEPGAQTLYHRHHANTLYVVMTGGRWRSDQPGHQPQRTGIGRSVPVTTKLAAALRRRLGGAMRLPAGTLLMQYHNDFPLTHRLRAAASNPEPIRMLGIELLSEAHGPQHSPVRIPGLSVEYHDRQATTYRIRLAPGQSTGPLHTGRPALLVPLAVPGQPRSAPVGETAPSLRWLASDDDWTLDNPGPTPLDALLVAMNQSPGMS